MSSRPSLIPITGASSVQQLDEQLGAMGLVLDGATMDCLDRAGREIAEPSLFIGQPVTSTR